MHLRCHPTDVERYKRLAHGLGNLGYRLIGEENWSACGKWPSISGEVRRRYLPAHHFAGSSFGNDSCNRIAPTIAITRDADGYAPGDLSLYLAIGWITASESREIAERFARAKGRTFTGEAFFGQIISCSTCGDDDILVRWRVFYLDGEPF